MPEQLDSFCGLILVFVFSITSFLLNSLLIATIGVKNTLAGNFSFNASCLAISECLLDIIAIGVASDRVHQKAQGRNTTNRYPCAIVRAMLAVQ